MVLLGQSKGNVYPGFQHTVAEQHSSRQNASARQSRRGWEQNNEQQWDDRSHQNDSPPEDPAQRAFPQAPHGLLGGDPRITQHQEIKQYQDEIGDEEHGGQSIQLGDALTPESDG